MKTVHKPAFLTLTFDQLEAMDNKALISLLRKATRVEKHAECVSENPEVEMQAHIKCVYIQTILIKRLTTQTQCNTTIINLPNA